MFFKRFFWCTLIIFVTLPIDVNVNIVDAKKVKTEKSSSFPQSLQITKDHKVNSSISDANIFISKLNNDTEELRSSVTTTAIERRKKLSISGDTNSSGKKWKPQLWSARSYFKPKRTHLQHKKKLKRKSNVVVRNGRIYQIKNNHVNLGSKRKYSKNKSKKQYGLDFNKNSLLNQFSMFPKSKLSKNDVLAQSEEIFTETSSSLGTDKLNPKLSPFQYTSKLLNNETRSHRFNTHVFVPLSRFYATDPPEKKSGKNRSRIEAVDTDVRSEGRDVNRSMDSTDDLEDKMMDYKCSKADKDQAGNYDAISMCSTHFSL